MEKFCQFLGLIDHAIDLLVSYSVFVRVDLMNCVLDFHAFSLTSVFVAEIIASTIASS
jgi:hypothetical protein